mmetsp:Transcript_39978/g.29484  ORF Transcript_39978/g.29484 Transcript_39978/m.29484 type:complete len:92 (+) Transcript_39978:807-1082(+)
MEKDLVLVGATCVEDRLQDRVPETIEALRNAGIKVWMLTGDKLETAIEIAKSCKVIQEGMRIIYTATIDEKGHTVMANKKDLSKIFSYVLE